MRRWVEIAACLALCALTWCGIEAALVLRDWRGVPDQVLALTSNQLTAAQGMVDARLASIEERADARTGDALALVDHRLGKVTETVAGIGGKAEETARSATRLVDSAERISRSLEPWLDCGGENSGEGKDCLQRRAWWMTLKADATMTAIATAAPKVAEAVEGSTLAAQQAAESAAVASQNVALLTKPGPRWLRYAGLGLSIAAPASQIALPFAVGALSRK